MRYPNEDVARMDQQFAETREERIPRQAADRLAEIAQELRLERDALREELRKAHQIIRNALAVMTTEQKDAWGRMNERDMVDGEGITRANEREALLKSTGATTSEVKP
jgi:regulator of replication initiation timing